MDPLSRFLGSLVFNLGHSDYGLFVSYIDRNKTLMLENYVKVMELISTAQTGGIYPSDKIDYIFSFISTVVDVKRIEKEEDIIALIHETQRNEKEDQTFIVRGIYDPKMMMRYGLLPSTIPSNQYRMLLDYLRNIPMSNLMFWYPHFFKLNNPFDYIYTWRYQSLRIHLENAEKSPDSLALNLLSDYPGQYTWDSNRAKTKMLTYYTPTSNRAKIEDIQDGIYSLQGKKWRAIPVSRYSEGMGSGLFNKKSNDKYCGTFYYLEPDSSTYLLCEPDRVMTSFCKTTAVRELGGSVYISDELEMYIDNELPLDLKLTPQEVMKVNSYPYRGEEPEPIKEYAGPHINLYGAEDDLDQKLCTMARERGIDVVILTNMVGSHQIVTEVLDTRSRRDSVSSLLYIID